MNIDESQSFKYLCNRTFRQKNDTSESDRENKYGILIYEMVINPQHVWSKHTFIVLIQSLKKVILRISFLFFNQPENYILLVILIEMSYRVAFGSTTECGRSKDTKIFSSLFLY